MWHSRGPKSTCISPATPGRYDGRGSWGGRATRLRGAARSQRLEHLHERATHRSTRIHPDSVRLVGYGAIDVIHSGHDPQDSEVKRQPFAEASNGAIGLAFVRVLVRPVYGMHLKQILITMGGMIIGEELTEDRALNVTATPAAKLLSALNTMADIGWKALAVNLSDLAAMAGYLSQELSLSASQSTRVGDAITRNQDRQHEPGFLWQVAADLQASLTAEQKQRLFDLAARLQEQRGPGFGDGPGGEGPHHGPGGRDERPGGGILDDLLTDEQKAAVQEIRERYRTSIEEAFQARRDGTLDDEGLRARLQVRKQRPRASEPDVAGHGRRQRVVRRGPVEDELDDVAPVAVRGQGDVLVVAEPVRAHGGRG